MRPISTLPTGTAEAFTKSNEDMQKFQAYNTLGSSLTDSVSKTSSSNESDIRRLVGN